MFLKKKWGNMEDPEQLNESGILVASILIKSFLVFFLFFLYVSVTWFLDSQNFITKIFGLSALILCFVSLFMSVKDKHFKRVLSFIAAFTIIFYASHWL